MQVEEVVWKVLVDEHADVLRESLRWLVAELMEVEVSELIGAGHGERRPEDRATHRNGYRSREWDTRAGEIELQVPRIRQGSYFASFLAPRKRSEQALLSLGAAGRCLWREHQARGSAGREPRVAGRSQRGEPRLRGPG
jgi:transposase-like protein